MRYPQDLTDLAERAHKYARSGGFWNGQDATNTTVKLAKLALIVSEVGEAIEAVRVPKGNVGEELADIIIRVLDLSEALSIDIKQAVLTKMGYNETRPHMHGKLA